ncbi:MAG: phosphoenolpyruvate carboxylase [Phycisphaerales bacterium JB039]
MTSPLARDISWLSTRLGEVESPDARAALQQIGPITEQMLGAGQLDPALAELDLEQIRAALKLLTIRFHLRNKAEQVHIARINRQRERVATPQAPRPESIAEAVGALRRGGVALEQLHSALQQLDIRPTLTAHPTESRRRSVIQKQSRIGDLLTLYSAEDTTPTERRRAASAVRQTLALLLATDEVRSRRLDVIDEVRNGLHYLAGPIWDAICPLYHDLADAIDQHYGERPPLPVIMRYRSWIGGDREGNPLVTADVTRRTFAELRQAAVARHGEALESLRRELSVSGRRVEIDPALVESIQRDEQERPLDPQLVRHLRHEPLRTKIRHMQQRLGELDYTAARFTEDLLTLQRALRFAGLDETAERGPLADAIVRARTFGFHLAALDIRQHSGVHEAVIAEMLGAAGVTSGYQQLDEAGRLEVLREELRSSRPLLAPGARLSAQSQELLDSLRIFAEAAQREPESVGSYIVSMSHDASDLLEVLVLLREVGLWTIEDGQVQCAIDVAPLFETVDDLERADVVVRGLLAEPAYRAQLEARGRFQEIMLGYSDSNKDGGYWAANWRLHQAQGRLAELCADAGLSLRFFHGRGGTVARGGGRANRAILASPPASRTGRIRFTEQGEVISFRYAMGALTHRHLEQIVSAMLLATAQRGQAAPDDGAGALMDDLADRSRKAYRALIDDPGFWETFISCSPVLHIGELPMASRPVSRSGGALQFDSLRAIPWVFSWTQMRYNAPGWYGVGSAFAELVLDDPQRLEACRGAYQRGGYFRAFIDNAQQEMARARLPVARWYTAQADPGLHDRLAAEFERAREAILAITGQEALLDNNPVIQQSIRERNGDTDIINALQVELLRRWRQADEAEQAALEPLILLSVNALAAAMQSTG